MKYIKKIKELKNYIQVNLKEDKKLMNLNHELASKKIIYPMAIGITICVFLGLNFIFNMLFGFGDIVRAAFSHQSVIGIILSYFFKISLKNIFFHFFSLIVAVGVSAYFTYQFYISNNDFNVQQKGGERFATLEEIQSQYKEINEKDVLYEGVGGFPVCRYEDKIYIDDSSVNNMALGMTRSGKTEMIVLVMLEIYSRAKTKSSLITTDPKGELLSGTKKILENRGWSVHCLNLIDTKHSMRYNPLTVVLTYYKQGNPSDGEEMANSVAYQIFEPNKQKGNEKYFAECAASLLVAFIIAIIEDSIGRDESKVNLPNVVRTFQNLTNLSIQSGNEIDYVAMYFNNRPEGDAATAKFTQAFVAGNRTKGSIYSTFLSKLTLFTYEGIARITSGNDLNIEDIGFGDKPIALFLEIPESDKSRNVIASIFIDQIYMVSAKKCALTKGRKCKQEIVHILEEMGNMPEIPNLDGKVTFGLGLGIKYSLFLHSFKQLNRDYGESEQIITDNMGNLMYIMCNSQETREKISKMIGNETITDIVRSGEKLKIGKTFTESKIEKPLKDANALAHLLEGENIIIRSIKRKDKSGKDIRSFPIFNSVESKTNYKYRYMYLKEMDTNLTFSELGITNISQIHVNDFLYTQEDLIKIIKDILSGKMGKITCKDMCLKELKQKEVLCNIIQAHDIEDINMETSVTDATQWLFNDGKNILSDDEINIVKEVIRRG